MEHVHIPMQVVLNNEGGRTSICSCGATCNTSRHGKRLEIGKWDPPKKGDPAAPAQVPVQTSAPVEVAAPKEEPKPAAPPAPVPAPAKAREEKQAAENKMAAEIAVMVQTPDSALCGDCGKKPIWVKKTKRCLQCHCRQMQKTRIEKEKLNPKPEPKSAPKKAAPKPLPKRPAAVKFTMPHPRQLSLAYLVECIKEGKRRSKMLRDALNEAI